MFRLNSISTSIAALVLAASLPASAMAQGAPDPHAGHHPAEAPVLPAPAPTPSVPATAPEAMMGSAGMASGQAMANGMGSGGGNMPMMGMMSGGDMPVGCMSGAGMPMAGEIEARITSLRTQLKIAGAQTGVWNAFADVLRANAKRAGQLPAGMMMGSKGAPAPSLTQQLQLHERRLVVGLQNLRALKPALLRLYASLSAEQKATADRLLGHHGGMMSGMPMSGSGMPMSGSGMPMPGMPTSGMPMGGTTKN